MIGQLGLVANLIIHIDIGNVFENIGDGKN